jgi:hypothetical protein
MMIVIFLIKSHVFNINFEEQPLNSLVIREETYEQVVHCVALDVVGAATNIIIMVFG